MNLKQKLPYYFSIILSLLGWMLCSFFTLTLTILIISYLIYSFSWIYIPIIINLGMLIIGAFFIFQGKKLKKKNKQKLEPKEDFPDNNSSIDLTNNSDLYKDFLAQLNNFDSIISSSSISVLIWRIEDRANKLFEIINTNSAREYQCRKFLSFYLPTTAKLLNSYQALEKQSIGQADIVNILEKIEQALTSIAIAFEKQLEHFFESDALDISTDIIVLESLLQQDGLAADKFNI